MISLKGIKISKLLMLLLNFVLIPSKLNFFFFLNSIAIVSIPLGVVGMKSEFQNTVVLQQPHS